MHRLKACANLNKSATQKHMLCDVVCLLLCCLLLKVCNLQPGLITTLVKGLVSIGATSVRASHSRTCTLSWTGSMRVMPKLHMSYELCVPMLVCCAIVFCYVLHKPDRCVTQMSLCTASGWSFCSRIMEWNQSWMRTTLFL